MKTAETIEEFFGTLQQSVIESWRKHLKTDSHDRHIILNDFYEDVPELIDTLIENWMGINGKVEDYKDIWGQPKDMDATEYLEELRKFVKDGRAKFFKGESELESDTDAILSLIDSTVYKLRELTESKGKSLRDFIMEHMSE